MARGNDGAHVISIQTVVDKNIMDALERAKPALLKRALRRSVKPNAKPALAAVKAATPVLSGKLQASWGIVPFFAPNTGEVGVTIEPKSSYTFTDTDGNKRLVTRRGRANKSVLRAEAKGITVDRKDPWRYAYGIEFGVSPKGRLTRRAGGAKMLEKGAQAGAQPFILGVTKDLQTFITAGTDPAET